jgi:hypothetical protein
VVSRRKISKRVEALVRQRAGGLCEFCHAAERWQYVKFTVDHWMPLSLGGSDALENLALACFRCNRRKGVRLSATDPESGAVVALFNPRQDRWGEHFVWSRDGRLVIGVTPIGRTTVAMLDLNRERVVAIRAADMEIGRHPPIDDPIQAD